MRQRLGFWILVGLLALGGAWVDKARAQVLEEMPFEWKIHARAASLEALAKTTGAVLTLEDAWGNPLLLETQRKGDERTFTFASAQKYWPTGGKAEWVALALGPKGELGDGGGVVPRTTVTVGKKPVWKGMSVHAWARVVSSDPQHGTLYEIAYFDQALASGAQEQRAYVMHDPVHGWQLVASLEGDYLEEAWVEVTKITVEWTGKADTPVILTRELKHGQEADGPLKPVVRYAEEVYRGKLPLEDAKQRWFVEVDKGDTVSGIVQRLVQEYVSWGKEAILKKVAADLRKEIQRLNPKVNLEQVQAGQRLIIPDLMNFDPIVKAQEGC